MGAELNIVRKNDWSNLTEESNITLEEWKQYADNDPELEPDKSEKDGFYFWKGYPEDHSFGVPWFNYFAGLIASKNPNIFVIQKMILIADALNAKICEEDGEIFDYEFLGL